MKSKYILWVLITLLAMNMLSACAPSPQVVLQDAVMDGQTMQAEESAEETGNDGPESDGTDEEAARDAERADRQQEEICLHICGAVWQPGVYALPYGSRLCDAVEAAGGFLPTASQDYCNLALIVSDGMQYQIPTTEEVQNGELPEAALAAAARTINDTGGGAANPQSSYDSNGLLDINLATAAELMTLPGIGQTRADAIVTYREEHGAFSEIKDIMLVSGIKDATYANIKGYITVR